MLDGTKLEPDFPWDMLAAATDNLSGSDLKELCRNAAMVPVREYLRDHAGQESVMAKAQAEVGQVLPTYSTLPHMFLGFLFASIAHRRFHCRERCTTPQ